MDVTDIENVVLPLGDCGLWLCGGSRDCSGSNSETRFCGHVYVFGIGHKAFISALRNAYHMF